MRKRCHRRAITPLPPRGLRQLLQPDQVRDLAMVHLVNLYLIARGQADEATLWQWLGGVLTWSRVADLLQAGQPEMRQQLYLASAVTERYGATQRIEFDADEYALARSGVDVMDQLAERVDQPTACAAADWSQRRIERMAAAATTGAPV